MKLRILLAVILSGMLFVGCSSSEQAVDNSNNSNLPSWYTSPPTSDSEYMYAVAEATSSRRSVARRQAMQNGRAALATKLEAEVSAMQKNYTEETTSGDNSNYREVFTDVSKSVAQQTLRGVEVTKSRFGKMDNNTKHNVLLLVRLPVGEAANALNQALKNTMNKDEELYTKFKSSKAFEDMKESIESMKNGDMPSEN